MIKLKELDLKPNTKKWLAKWQSIIDAELTYAAQLDKAKKLWPQKNQTATLSDIKDKLIQMCSGAKRCQYCEDSAAYAIEHFWPKDIYPEKTFIWKNHLYACSNCNGSKNNKFEIYCSSTDEKITVTPPHHTQRPKNYIRQRPVIGSRVLINPRRDNPLELISLDIVGGTFRFIELFPEGTREYERAAMTIAILDLNRRDYLLDARRKAFSNYKARLRVYVDDKDCGKPQTTLNEHIEELKGESHPTVWKEMIRQRQFIPELPDLFKRAPEALTF